MKRVYGDAEAGLPLRVRAPAKINLHLGVGDVRADGFHDLTTVYQAISLYDEVIVEPSSGLRLDVTGEGEGELSTGVDNLAVRAAVLLAADAGREPDVHIRLHKRIPLAGGLAGGSADAAATLLACARLWRLPIDRDRLTELAAHLGSDVPFCLLGGTALGTGRGERVEPLTDPGGYHWVLAMADGQLSTPKVYARVDELRAAGVGRYHDDVAPLREALRKPDARRLAALLHNDMQEAAVSLRPAVQDVLDAGIADGALAAIVSGSGPTTLFLARDVHHAHALAGRLRMRRVAREVTFAHGPVQGAHLY